MKIIVSTYVLLADVDVWHRALFRVSLEARVQFLAVFDFVQLDYLVGNVLRLEESYSLFAKATPRFGEYHDGVVLN